MSTLKERAEEYENQVLGAILGNPDKFYNIQPLFRPEMFAIRKNQIIAQAIIDTVADSKTPDALGVKQQIDKNGFKGEISPFELMELIDLTAPLKLTQAIILLSQRHLRRMVSKACQRAEEYAKNPSHDIFDTLENLTSEIYEIQNSFIGDRQMHPSEFGDEWVAQIRRNREIAKKGEITGIPTGVFELDKLTDGWQNGELIVIGAPPSVGKSIFAFQAATTAASKDKIVKIDSVEMVKDSVFRRMIVAHTGISNNKIKRGHIDDGEMAQIEEAVEDFKNKRIYIDDAASVKVGDIRAKARKMKMTHGLDMLIVDYLQLISSGRKGRPDRAADASLVSRKLKEIAKEFNIPVIAISSVNNEALKESDKRAKPHHLKESGDIWYAADVVITLYRPDRVGLKEFTDFQGFMHNATDLFVIDVWKQRDGAQGEVLAKIDGAKMRIDRFDEHGKFAPVMKFSPNDYTQPKKEDEDLPF